MVNILFYDDNDILSGNNVAKTIYDPACGTGGMLSVAEEYLHSLNASTELVSFGQEINDQTFAICKADMLIKGNNADYIKDGNTLSDDQFAGSTFDYILSNPPFGREWKNEKAKVEEGKDYAKNTPHIKYMLIGQDFGPPEKEEVKGTIANVRKMNDGVEVMFHENVDLEARDSQTDKNIVRYFELLGKEKIDEHKYPDLFFCNCNLGYRRDKYSGNMTRKILANDVAEIKSLIDIIEPENIICLGLDTSVVVIRTLIDKKFSCNRVSELIGTGEPYIYGETYIYPVAHPGYWGTSTRGEDNVIADWRRIRK